VIAPSARVLAFVVACVHPPYPVLPFAFMVSGFGNGLEDGAWNAWVGNMSNANELLGLLHGAYGLGATISPLIATSMITKANLQWYQFYYIMVSMKLSSSGHLVISDISIGCYGRNRVISCYTSVLVE